MPAIAKQTCKNIALAMLGDTRSPLAYRSRGVWLLCSFQGPSEKGRDRRTASRGGARAHGLSKLNSMLARMGRYAPLPRSRVGRRARPLGRSRPVDIRVHELESSEGRKRRLARFRSGPHLRDSLERR